MTWLIFLKDYSGNCAENRLLGTGEEVEAGR